MKVIIAGGRDFTDVVMLTNYCADILCATKEVEVVCGCSQGADILGLDFAAAFGYEVELFPPDWDKHGKAAGPIRNKEMVEYADALIAFWDGKSRGTKDVIDQATKAGLKVRVKRYG